MVIFPETAGADFSKAFPDIPDSNRLSLFGNMAVNRYDRLLRVVPLDISTTLAV